MTSEVSDPRKALERERDRLDDMLEQNDAWRALRQLDQQEAASRPGSAGDRSELRQQFEAALAGDRVYQARRKLSEAITLLAGSPEPTPASARRAAGPELMAPNVAADDLTRIRGIDGALAARLRALGIDGFATIAAWSADEVHRVTAALGLDRRIHRENWIEQAALILSRRGPGHGTVPPAIAPAPVVQHPAAARPIDPAPVKPVADLVSAAIRSILARAKPPVAEPLAVEPVAPVAAPPAVEDLTLIRGLDAAAAAVLGAEGVTSFAAIAGWSAADVARLRGVLGPGVPLVRAQWIEQAAILAAGQSPRHVRTRAIRAAIPLAPRPASTAVARDEGFACALRKPPVMPEPAPAVPATNPPVPTSAPAIAPVSHATPAASPEPAAAPVRHVLAVKVLPPQPVVAARAAPSVFTLPPLSLQVLPEIGDAPPAPVDGVSLPDLDPADETPLLDYNSDSLFDIAATNFAEADVQIVPAAAPVPSDEAAYDPRPLVYGSGAGSLQSRLRKAGDPDDSFDSRDYAAYRTAVEEAAVEIVHRGGAARVQPGTEAGPTPPASEDGGPKTVRRFLKALTGQDR